MPGALLVPSLIFFVISTAVALLLLWGWWAGGQKLEELLLGLLLLVGKEGNLLLQALYTGRHLLYRLHCRGKLIILLLALLKLMPSCHVDP